MSILQCIKGSPVQKRFVNRMFGTALFSVVFSVAAALAFRLWHLKGPFSYPVAVLPALPIIGALLAVGAYLAEETDEFQRNLMVQSLLGGIGGTLSAVTIWGYLEDYLRAPHLDLTLVNAIFWVFVGLSFPIVYRRYR